MALRRAGALALALMLAPLSAFPQAIQQAGPWTQGHAPSFSGGGMSTPFVTDGGPAGGGAPNPLQEMELVNSPYPNGNAPPYAGTGTGVMGSNWCDYDAPLNSAGGYHFLCISPNSTSNAGLIDYGAVGAAAQPLYFIINGVSYNISQSLPTFAANSVLVSGATQTEWSTTLPNSLNLQTPSALVLTNATGEPTSINLTHATLCAISSCVSGLGTGVATALGNATNTTGGIPTVPVTVSNGGTGALNFTSNLPLIGNGTAAVAQGTISGNTTEFATASGTLTNGHCVSINGGNFVDAGGACTTGGGGGTVSSGTAGQVAYYGSSGTVVSGETPASLNYTQSTNSTGVQRTFQGKFDDWISAKDYGAAGNGSTDDTTALNTWLTAISTTGKCGYLPAGTYKITAALTPITVGGWCISGAGQYASTIEYTGASTTANIFEVNCTVLSPCNNIGLSEFQVISTTTMTAGYGVDLVNVMYSNLRDIGLSQYTSGNQNLYNGIAFANSSWNTWVGGDVYVSHYGVSAWGSSSAQAAELSLDELRIVFPGDTALYLGGGFGGLYTGYVSVEGGAVGLRVDTTITGTGNKQVFVSNRTVFDGQTSAGVVLNDTLTGSNISFLGWCGSTSGSAQGCLDIVNWHGGYIQIGGGAQFLNNVASGILDEDASVNLRIDTGALFELNHAYGVNCTVSVPGVYTAFQGASNTSGDLSPNCHGQKATFTAF